MRLAAVLLVLARATQTWAQEPETKLVIQQAGREIGREQFSLSQGRGRGAPGSSLHTTASYPANNPTLRLGAVLERTPESALAKFQLDVEGPGGPTVILAAGSGARLIIRTVAKGSEAGRELPGGPPSTWLWRIWQHQTGDRSRRSSPEPHGEAHSSHAARVEPAEVLESCSRETSAEASQPMPRDG
jgi:hypothetical protein